MTAQIAESLRYEGQVLSMCCEPLSDYFELAGVEPGLQATCTAVWRGYVGTWEVVDRRLYLVELEGEFKDGRQASLASFFPEHPSRVFAHWYSGTIRVPQGELLHYRHSGYASVYERDLLLEVREGEVVGSQVVRNGTAEEKSGKEGYVVGAMTTFPREPR